MAEYARIENGMLVDIVTDGCSIEVGGEIIARPTVSDFARGGYLIVDRPSAEDAGYVLRWERAAVPQAARPALSRALIEASASVCGHAVPVIDRSASRVSNRKFSKAKIYDALVARGKWDDVKAWMTAQGKWDAFSLCVYVEESNPTFAGCLSDIASLLGMSAEQKEAFLSSVVYEED